MDDTNNVTNTVKNNMDTKYTKVYWLVVSTTLKNMSSSVGMMKFPLYGKMKFMFQTTNQYIFCHISVIQLQPTTNSGVLGI
jgi:hypothetical protein